MVLQIPCPLHVTPSVQSTKKIFQYDIYEGDIEKHTGADGIIVSVSTTCATSGISIVSLVTHALPSFSVTRAIPIARNIISAIYKKILVTRTRDGG